MENEESDEDTASEDGEPESVDDPVPLMEPSMPTPPKRSASNEFRDKMEQKKQKRKKGAPTSCLPSTALLAAIKQDMKEYEVTGVRSEKLERVRRICTGKS